VNGLSFVVDGEPVTNTYEWPVLQVVCDGCGQILTFDAMRTRLIFEQHGGLSHRAITN